MAKRRKKHRLRNFFLFIAALLLCWYWSTFTLTVNQVTVRNQKVKESIKIVQITDLHGSLFGKENGLLLQKIKAQEPDFIAVTGDMYTHGDDAALSRAVALLRALAVDFPVYYVNGEHDNSETFHNALENAGVRYLDYETENLEIRGTPVTLYGINNVYYSPTFNLKNAFTLDESRLNILLAHSENMEDFADFGLDLVLCGDTHGGQVRLPYAGALVNNGIWLPELKGKRYTKGLYEQDGTQLFISSGLGNYPVPLRFLNRPEIAVLTVVPE